MPPLTGSTRLAGVVGWPVSHSLSPRLHGAWLRRHGIDGAYLPLAVAPGRLETALRGLAAAGFAGVNVTVPHKEDAFRLSDVLSPAAARCQAVNTLVFRADGLMAGDCSDGTGFLDNLRASGVDPAAGPALVLGAGGAARAIAAALQDAGVQVQLANRTRARAEQMADALGRSAPAGAPRVRVLDWAAREAALGDQALLVNATTIGLGRPESPCRLDPAPDALVVADIVYSAQETRLMAEARARGLRTVEGLGMLLHQARTGFAAWFGVMPAVDAEIAAYVAAPVRHAP